MKEVITNILHLEHRNYGRRRLSCCTVTFNLSALVATRFPSGQQQQSTDIWSSSVITDAL